MCSLSLALIVAMTTTCFGRDGERKAPTMQRQSRLRLPLKPHPPKPRQVQQQRSHTHPPPLRRAGREAEEWVSNYLINFVCNKLNFMKYFRTNDESKSDCVNNINYER